MLTLLAGICPSYWPTCPWGTYSGGVGGPMGITNPAIDPRIGTAGNDPISSTQLFLTNFIRLGFVVGAVVFFGMLVTGAIQYITTGGDKERTGNAAKRITSALIGLTILFSAYAIAKLVKLVFGIDVLHLEIPVIT